MTRKELVKLARFVDGETARYVLISTINWISAGEDIDQTAALEFIQDCLTEDSDEQPTKIRKEGV